MSEFELVEMEFNRVGIFGVGLLGGSLGMSLKQHTNDIEIIGIGRSAERLQTAVEIKAIDSYACEPQAINPPLDLLVICTPVRLVPGHLERSLPALKEGALVTDVGSTKATVVEQCEAIGEGKIHFIGSHPIAGSHKTGVTAAQPTLFHKKTCVVTPTSKSPPHAVHAIESFWCSIGMKVVHMTPEEHDRLLAHSSHLPHMAAVALCHVVKNIGDEIKPVLGSGFRDTTRVAAGDPAMWLDICLENKTPLLDSLQSLQTTLTHLQTLLQTRNEEGLRQFLQQAQDWKHKG